MYTSQVLVNKRSVDLAKDFVKVVSFVFFLSISSHVKLYLPFSPVPVTLQTLALFLNVAFLGRKSVYSLFIWVILGIIGLPVFSGGAGFLYFLGPTAGYIIGFVLAGLVLSGILFLRKSARWYFACFLLASIIIYSMGVIWLLSSMSLSFEQAINIGFLPFAYGWLLKITLATLITRLIKR